MANTEIKLMPKRGLINRILRRKVRVQYSKGDTLGIVVEDKS